MINIQSVPLCRFPDSYLPSQQLGLAHSSSVSSDYHRVIPYTELKSVLWGILPTDSRSIPENQGGGGGLILLSPDISLDVGG